MVGVILILVILIGMALGTVIFAIPLVVSGIGMALMHFKLRRECGYSFSGKLLLARAQKGDPDACHKLGMAHLKGTSEFFKDGVTAAQWLERAANAGHPQAKIDLEEMLSWDQGAANDPRGAEIRRARAKAQAQGNCQT